MLTKRQTKAVSKAFKSSVLYLPAYEMVHGEMGRKRRHTSFSKEEDENQIPIQNQFLLTKMQKNLVVAALALCMFLSSLDTTLVSASMPAVSDEFNASSSSSWVGTAYMIANCAFQPIYSKLGNIFGRRYTIIAAIIVFLTGSALCGVAKNILMVIIGRAIAGVGGAGLATLPMLIITEIIPFNERGIYMGMIGGVYALSNVLGPILGGILVGANCWRCCFYVNIPTGAISIILLTIFLQVPRDPTAKYSDFFKIDFIGLFNLVAFLVTALLISTFSGSGQYQFKDPIMIVLVVLCIILLISFVASQFYFTNPLINPAIFNRNVSLSVAANFFLGFFMFSSIFFIPYFFKIVRGLPPIQAGVKMLPMMLSIVLFSIISGVVMSLTGKYKPLIWIGGTLCAVMPGLMSLMKERSSAAREIGFLALSGVGIGMCIQTLLLAAQLACDPKHISAVTTVSSFSRQLGGTLGIGLQGAVFRHKIKELVFLGNIGKYLLVKLDIKALPKEIYDKLQDIYVEGLRTMFLSMVPFGILVFICSVCIQHVDIKKEDDYEMVD